MNRVEKGQVAYLIRESVKLGNQMQRGYTVCNGDKLMLYIFWKHFNPLKDDIESKIENMTGEVIFIW